jgi:uncharacterized delta-60 repeat protein
LTEPLERRVLLSAGDPDLAFGGDGVARNDFGGTDFAESVALQPDGKLLVLGRRGFSHSQFRPNHGFILARYLPGGTLDPTFGRGDVDGIDGVTIRTAGRDEVAFDVAVAPDGKIVVSGRAVVGRLPSQTPHYETVVMRFNGDGTLDRTFGRGGPDGDGIVRTDVRPAISAGRAVAVQPDGKVIVSDPEFGLIRHNADGTLDTTFGPDGTGIVVAPISGPFSGVGAVALLPDGRILAAGTAGVARIGVARFLPDGTLDTTFGADGVSVVTVPHGGGASDLVVAPDGRFFVAGTAATNESAPTGHDFLVAAFRPDGALDPGFGAGGLDGDGVVTTDFEGNNDGAAAVALAPDGKLIAMGTATVGGASLFAAARYLPDGALDPTFDGDGRLSFAPEGRAGNAADGALLPDGRIVLAGTTDGDFTVARLLGDPPPPRTLVVDGTPGDDRISVDAAGDGVNLLITVNGVTTTRPLAGVTGITVNGNAGNDRIIVSNSLKLPATLDGGPGNDHLTGGGGNDMLLGGDGGDTLDGRGGADLFRGGAGTDTVDYTLRRNPVTVGIGTAADDGERGEGDNVFSDVENIWGGRGNDTLRGSSANNRLAGGAGDDLVVGMGGSDVLLGGDGNDLLLGRDATPDTLDGGDGTDAADADRSDVVTGVERRGAAERFDPADQFSEDHNPGGPWSYGFSSDADGPLTLYDRAETVDGAVRWSSTAIGIDPNAQYNPTDHDAAVAGSATLRPGDLTFHPGPQGQWSHIVFRAPNAGFYDVTGTFGGLDVFGTTTDVRIRVGGRDVFSGSVNGARGKVVPFSVRLPSLNAGDRIDFAVGAGANGDYHFDTTLLGAAITAVR